MNFTHPSGSYTGPATPTYIRYFSDRYRTRAPPYGASPSVPPARRPYPLQTVEDIIDRGYLAQPTGDPVTAVLTDHSHTRWLALDDAIRQIRARYDIYARNMTGILYASAAAMNAYHTWRAERGWPSDRQVDNLQRTLQELAGQERDERNQLWRDLARIRETLPDVAQEYLGAQRKLALLDGGDPA